ncbi:hypothetical protein [Candidatus Symbiopectobacterium sp. 'North America']|uniref:hypothetical protein n=1 Tax=Candidatus Symbiopectobacterium sp. 'North America' TaxID=2794574 RepID=UPI001FD41783|nr:hypothetical protein [Candidatus Symbiopectobacterium sp. 'North America']
MAQDGSFSFTVPAGTFSDPDGDPQFRVTTGTSVSPSGESQTPQSLTAGNAPQTLSSLFSANALGSFNTGNTTAAGSIMSTIFTSSRHERGADNVPTSEVASTFAGVRALSSGTQFDSSLGSFPSFSKNPALRGSSSLASVFSGIYLPSLTPMEVFNHGSWKGIGIHPDTASTGGSAPAIEKTAAIFTPSLHQQLQ